MSTRPEGLRTRQNIGAEQWRQNTAFLLTLSRKALDGVPYGSASGDGLSIRNEAMVAIQDGGNGDPRTDGVRQRMAEIRLGESTDSGNG